MKRQTRLACFVFALFGSMPAFAEDPLRIPRAAHPPKIEDYIGQPPSDAGVDVSDFRQNKPGDGTPVSLETHAYLSYDDEHLYVVFVCKDDPNLVRARIVRRENIFGDEGVQVLIDTFHDKQRAFVFSTNPYGVQLDSKLTEGIGYDFNFDTQWTSDGRVTNDGYVVTMQIPFKSLRFERSAAQNWGIAVGRIIPRNNEFVYWPYITQRKEGFVPQFATAIIDHDVSPGRNIQVIPYSSFRDTRALDVDQARMRDERKWRSGIDAKFVVQDALAVDVTVNPDFSEVESDAPQVIVNQRYEVQFPEKRPFFLENASFFDTPNTLFFSRRIYDPQFGVRTTGRLGRWALGGLLIDDRQAGDLLPADDPDAGKRAYVGALRLQRDFGAQSNIGALVTERKIGGHNNTVASLDSRIKLNDNWAFTAQAVGSRTRASEASGGNRDGHLGFLQLTRGGRNFNYDIEYADIARDFDAELGFVPRVDIRQLYQKASYLWQFPDAPWLVSAGPSVIAYRTWDQNNRPQDWSVDSGFAVNGLRATTFEGHWLESAELYRDINFRKHGWSLSASTEWFKWLTTSLKVTQENRINYYPAQGVLPFLGDATQYELGLTLSPFAQLRIDHTLIWNDLNTRAPIAAVGRDATVFSNMQWQTKFNYQFTRFLALRVIFDYTALLPDTTLFAAERSKNFSSDILLSYTPSPGTAIYLGYTDRQENLHLFENPNFVSRTSALDLHTGKQVFVKASYLFNF